MTYEIDIAGLKRQLPLCRVTDELYIGAFVMFGDVELTEHCARELVERAPEFDYILCPEAKAIPLAYEMSRRSGKKYFVARKAAKAYMKEIFEVKLKSITTMNVQTLILDKEDADQLSGKRVLLVDDVISTGESINAVEKLAEEAGAEVVGKATPLAEGDSFNRSDIIALGQLPLFNADGSVK